MSIALPGGFHLRKPEPSDVERLYVLKNDLELADLLGGSYSGYARADLAKWVEFHRSAVDEAFFVIADAEDRAVGHVALYKIHPIHRSAEFAILVGDRGLWGTGLGKHATKAVIEHGFRDRNLHRIYLEVHEDNPRAAALYRRLGFVEEGRLRHALYKRGRYLDVLMMALLAEDYRGDPG